jgi:hypothetical protein
MKCVHCEAELAPGEAVCPKCGQAAAAPAPLRPPDPAARYPLREFPMKLGELVGWPEEQVLAALGQPNDNAEGRSWRSPDPAAPGSFWRSEAGKIIRVHVFGPVPSRIPVATPYRVWTYHNVRGSTWVLYLSQALIPDPGQAQATAAPSAEATRPGVGEKLARLFRKGRGRGRAGQRVVVEVYQYPTGAVF